MSDQTTTPATETAAATNTAMTDSEARAEIAALREQLKAHEITSQEFRAQLDAIKAEREAEREAAKTKATVVPAPATGADDPAKPKGKLQRRWF